LLLEVVALNMGRVQVVVVVAVQEAIKQEQSQYHHAAPIKLLSVGVGKGAPILF
jgi:hypothetical protein